MIARPLLAVLLCLAVTLVAWPVQPIQGQERVSGSRTHGQQQSRPRSPSSGRVLDANLRMGSGGYNTKRRDVTRIDRSSYTVNRGSMRFNSNNAFTPQFRYTATTYRTPYAHPRSQRFRGYR